MLGHVYGYAMPLFLFDPLLSAHATGTRPQPYGLLVCSLPLIAPPLPFLTGRARSRDGKWFLCGVEGAFDKMRPWYGHLWTRYVMFNLG